jgi:regulatory LuxR family protein
MFGSFDQDSPRPVCGAYVVDSTPPASRRPSGRSNAAIAKQLVLTVGAVEKHVANILTKLRLPPSSEDHRRVLAVLAYLRGTGD